MLHRYSVGKQLFLGQYLGTVPGEFLIDLGCDEVQTTNTVAISGRRLCVPYREGIQHSTGDITTGHNLGNHCAFPMEGGRTTLLRGRSISTHSHLHGPFDSIEVACTTMVQISVQCQLFCVRSRRGSIRRFGIGYILYVIDGPF